MFGVGRWLISWVLGISLLASGVSAETADSHGTASAPETPWLRWSAPPECPDASQIEARLTEWLGAPLAPKKALSVRGVADWTGEAWEVKVDLDYGTHSGQRRVLVDTCAEAADFVALTVALAVEPGLRPEALGDSAALEEREERSAEEGPEAAPSERASEAIAVGTTSTPRDQDADGSRRRKEAPAAFDALAGASLVWLVGPLPDPRWGGAVDVGLSVRAFRFELGALLVPRAEHAIPAAENDADFGLLAGRAHLGYGFGSGRWQFGPYLEAQVGALQVEEQVDAAASRTGHRASELWVSALLGGEANLALTSWLSSHLGAGAVLPVIRPRFELAQGALVHRPTFGLQVEWGLRANF